MNIKTFLHSGDCGDIMSSLSTIKLLCIKNNCKARLYLDTTGGGKCNDKELNMLITQNGKKERGLRFNINEYNFIKPLIEIQDYIESVQLWDESITEIDYNLNKFRSIMNNMDYVKPTNQNLEYLHRICFGLPITHIDIPPLKCGKRDVPSKIGIARTTRYTSAHLFLAMREEIFKHAMFLGTPFEYEVFKNAFNYEPIYMEINNALDAAEIINSTDIFFANGTLMYWIAVGLGHKHVINELGVDIPTTYFRDNPNISYVQGGRVVK